MSKIHGPDLACIFMHEVALYQRKFCNQEKEKIRKDLDYAIHMLGDKFFFRQLVICRI
jgi:hypothetical protein